MKKAKFKYKIGTEVKFKFFDGSIHTGAIVKQSYQGDDIRGFMLYPSVGPNRIIESNGITNKAYIYGKKSILNVTTKRKSKSTSTELSDAISKQKDFINGKVNN